MSTRPGPPPLPPRPQPPPIPPKFTRPAAHSLPRPPAARLYEYKHLSPEQVDFFLAHGYVHLPGVFDPAKAGPWLSMLWPRLGYSAEDRSTWSKERIHLPAIAREHASTFAPAAWGAICELLGGEDRIDDTTGAWSDAFIVNLGVPGTAPTTGTNDGRKLWDWHVDGDFFVHFLDSREQGLLVVPLFSDIVEGAGGTMIAPESIGVIARYLRDHPEGVQPAFGGGRWFIEQAHTCKEFVEVTGKAGDVVLMHPFMLHSASRNFLRTPRVITNPRVGLKRPFTYGKDGSALSLVERKTLLELGVHGEKLEWEITGERKGIVPERERKK